MLAAFYDEILDKLMGGFLIFIYLVTISTLTFSNLALFIKVKIKLKVALLLLLFLTATLPSWAIITCLVSAKPTPDPSFFSGKKGNKDLSNIFVFNTITVI